MSETKQATSVMTWLQALQLAVTIALAVLGFFLNRSTEEARQAIAELDSQLRLRQEERALQESAERLRFQLFGHVSSAIEKKNEQHQLAAKALVTSLLKLDDPLRQGLLEALRLEATGAAKSALEDVARAERLYQAEQQSVTALVANPAQPAPTASRALLTYAVDVFYCAGGDESVRKGHAESLAAALQNKVQRTRVRAFAQSLNASPGYGVTGTQIRYNKEERAVAEELHAALKEAGNADYLLREVSQWTPSYLSVFVC